MSAFIQARNYTRGRIKSLRLIVWHDMEAPENATTAEAVAAYFAGPNAPQASAHVCVDNDSAVDCVNASDTAWHAPGANADGYGIELAGYARQSAAEWQDAYSLQAIRNACGHVAPLMKAHGIPARWLTDDELRGGVVKGMTTHAQVSRVFRLSDHSDPGPGFPMALVQAELARQLGTASPVASGVITVGASGEAVKGIQRIVGATPDGSFGPATMAAVAKWQAAHGLAADGVWGPASAAKAAAPAQAPAKVPAVVARPVSSKPKPSIPPFPGTTRQGSRVSGATRAFQQRLAARGWPIAVDGVQGISTTADLKAFQRQAGLTPDGVGGPATWAALWTVPVTK
jgi:peptidoglycan hydrolase-like protein with peptidoglycan-binding domain